MKFNPGTFKGDTYTKRVRFSKAVLWKDKQISLNDRITAQFKPRGIVKIVFEDTVKNERWTAKVDDLRKVAVLKREGQEKQFYFPIEVFKKEPIDTTKTLKLENADPKRMTAQQELEHNRRMQKLFEEI